MTYHGSESDNFNARAIVALCMIAKLHMSHTPLSKTTRRFSVRYSPHIVSHLRRLSTFARKDVPLARRVEEHIGSIGSIDKK